MRIEQEIMRALSKELQEEMYDYYIDKITYDEIHFVYTPNMNRLGTITGTPMCGIQKHGGHIKFKGRVYENTEWDKNRLIKNVIRVIEREVRKTKKWEDDYEEEIKALVEGRWFMNIHGLFEYGKKYAYGIESAIKIQGQQAEYQIKRKGLFVYGTENIVRIKTQWPIPQRTKQRVEQLIELLINQQIEYIEECHQRYDEFKESTYHLPDEDTRCNNSRDRMKENDKINNQDDNRETFNELLEQNGWKRVGDDSYGNTINNRALEGWLFINEYTIDSYYRYWNYLTNLKEEIKGQTIEWPISGRDLCRLTKEFYQRKEVLDMYKLFANEVEKQYNQEIREFVQHCIEKEGIECQADPL